MNGYMPKMTLTGLSEQSYAKNQRSQVRRNRPTSEFEQHSVPVPETAEKLSVPTIHLACP
jgi:hypothetical protein